MICPKCGDSLSSATKVCPRCGYVVDDRIDGYLNDLQENMSALKALPAISFGSYFSRNAYIMYFMMTVIFLIVMFMTDAGLFLILAVIAAVMLVFSVVRKISNRRNNAENEQLYKLYLIAVDDCMKVLKRDYSESRKVRDVLRDTASELKDIRDLHDINRRHSLKVWIAVMLLTLAVSVAGILLLGMRDTGSDTLACAESVTILK